MSSNIYTPGPSKEYIRNSVFLHFKDCSYVLTLPNLYFGLERMLLKDGKKVDCTEYEVNTFKGQQQSYDISYGQRKCEITRTH